MTQGEDCAITAVNYTIHFQPFPCIRGPSHVQLYINDLPRMQVEISLDFGSMARWLPIKSASPQTHTLVYNTNSPKPSVNSTAQ